jgi:tail tube protein
MPNPSYRQFLALAKEPSWATAAAVTTFLPVKKPSGWVPEYEDLIDDSYRNNASDEQQYLQGVGMTNFDTGEIKVYADDSIHFIAGLLGVDTQTGAGPWTHTLTLLNTGDPVSYTMVLFDNLIATARRIVGAQISELAIKWSTKGWLTFQAKGVGKIADTVAKPTEAFSAANPYRGWQLVPSVGGANTKMEEGEITIRRQIDPVFGAAGTQDMNQRSIDSLHVEGAYTFASTDDSEKTLYTASTQPASSLVFTDGTNTLTFQMTKTAFSKGSDIDRSAYYSRVRLPFHAIANSTDAGTGNSPLKVVAVNQKNGVYV